MAQPSSSLIQELLTQRLGLLRALAESLNHAQAALATITPEKLDRHTAHQRELCRQLRSLSTGFRDESSAAIPAGLANHVQETARRVADLNRRYAALLRRRRRTVDIFCRVLATSGITYPAPRMLTRPDSKVRGRKE
jgi:hypothetical protein